MEVKWGSMGGRQGMRERRGYDGTGGGGMGCKGRGWDGRGGGGREKGSGARREKGSGARKEKGSAVLPKCRILS
jgi:hypothetical protein